MKKHILPLPVYLPFIAVIIGIFLVGYGIYEYSSESKYNSWTETTAIITDMTSYEDSDRDIYYTKTYSYQVNGTEYYGSTKSKTPIQLGTEISVKYNPSNPEESTTITKPGSEFLLTLLGGGAFFIFVGATMIITMKKRGIFDLLNYEEEERKRYRESHKGERKKREPFNYKSLAYLLIPILFFAFVFLVMQHQASNYKEITSMDFSKVMFDEGYQVDNMSDILPNYYGVGSIMETAYSCNADDMRVDFCEMNSEHNAKLLFDSVILTANEKTISQDCFIATENGEVFCVKAYYNKVFIYAECTKENKNELLKILTQLGIYNG